MNFKFLLSDGRVVTEKVEAQRGGFTFEAKYLDHNFLPCKAPISQQDVSRIFDEVKQHAEEELSYARKVSMDAPHSSTAQAYRGMLRFGLMGDDDFNAISHLLEKLKSLDRNYLKDDANSSSKVEPNQEEKSGAKSDRKMKPDQEKKSSAESALAATGYLLGKGLWHDAFKGVSDKAEETKIIKETAMLLASHGVTESIIREH